MSRHHLDLMAYAALVELAPGGLHHFAVGFAAHDDTHKHRFELDADQQRIDLRTGLVHCPLPSGSALRGA